MDAASVLNLPRAMLRDAPDGEARAFVGAACLCAAGTSRPPSSERLKRLVERLRGEAPVAATLAGARIEADGATVRFLREAGEMARGGLQPLNIRAGETAVWDGRFEVTAERTIEVRALKGLAARLAPAERRRLAEIPARARPSLPVVVEGAQVRLARGRPLALERLSAACGLIGREPD